MTTPAEARAAFIAYLKVNHPGQTLTSMEEDGTDYIAITTVENDIWPIGGSWVFIEKATGQIHEEPHIAMLDKVDAMTPVVEQS